MKRAQVAEDILKASLELQAISELMEAQAEHCWTKEGADGMAILIRRIAQRLRRKSEIIELGPD